MNSRYIVNAIDPTPNEARSTFSDDASRACFRLSVGLTATLTFACSQIVITSIITKQLSLCYPPVAVPGRSGWLTTAVTRTSPDGRNPRNMLPGSLSKWSNYKCFVLPCCFTRLTLAVCHK
ncbi:hypothetical protein BaRGS_00009868 [Batillaria attramentaria]|uniref:Uncharacterized protein n=1 Tax=Batillaria attramentaria TaxID=370345 RepID=A0ABD0LGY3_9CAEN